jgi:phospholipid/cholesterol/gamma-HCH transport system ATP-binding protein
VLLTRTSPVDTLKEPAGEQSPAVELSHVSFAFGEHVVLRDVSFSVPRGGLKFLLGASGSGKSVTLKLIAGLLRPDSGTIIVNGERIDSLPERDLLRTRSDIGIVFQENALFDSLTVEENVGYHLFEETDMPEAAARARVKEVLGFVGLDEYVDRLPSELSGGQRRRVAIARAMASKPHVLLYDDPTTGLDPITSITVDNEIVKLRDLERVTSVVVTHQIRDAFYIADHRAIRLDDEVRVVSHQQSEGGRAEFMVLHEGRIHFHGNAAELLASTDPYLRRFLYMTLPPW